jgi:hypothetical protein
MQLALNVYSNFLDVLHSTTARYLPHSVLELFCAEIMTSASQLEAYLQAAPVEIFQIIISLSSQPVR